MDSKEAVMDNKEGLMDSKEEISSRIYHTAMRSNSNKRKIRIGKINITMPIMAFSGKI